MFLMLNYHYRIKIIEGVVAGDRAGWSGSLSSATCNQYGGEASTT